MPEEQMTVILASKLSRGSSDGVNGNGQLHPVSSYQKLLSLAKYVYMENKGVEGVERGEGSSKEHVSMLTLSPGSSS